MKKTEHDQKEILRPLEADGIKEYDNDLPRWWVGLFYLTAIIGVVYAVKLHFIGGESLIDAYNKGMEQSKQDQQQGGEHQPAGDGGNTPQLSLAEKMASVDFIKAGRELFATNCSPCHGADGGGVIGPNLTDKFWIHGGSPEQIIAVISNGVPEKGMVAWKPILGEAKIEHLAAFILSLKGTTPAQPKEPQGDPVE